ncbi:MAG TPA: phosphoribosylglycinamide formyltransferase [Chitinophagaceae bacterium]|nr:phosphoribosylglycinamide formyltransferase [Chitinophagaceae bacterium]
MFERLQKKWKVNGIQLILILTTFACGGSLTGYTGRKLMEFLPIEQNWLWLVVYILLVTLLWPISVLLVSIFFGQYKFFSGYLNKMGSRIFGRQSNPSGQQSEADPGQEGTIKEEGLHNIAIFASGAGSNAQKIIDYFKNSGRIKIALIACNKPGAGVFAIAKKENVPFILIEKEKFFRGNGYLEELRELKVDFIVLAGFLWKIPSVLLENFQGRIVNIHPALLPKYGGKGMYGRFVHESVLANKEKESGITIHYVDGHYDNGDIIFQAHCPVLPNDTPDSLASRVHQLEHKHYPRVIEEVVMSGFKV